MAARKGVATLKNYFYYLQNYFCYLPGQSLKGFADEVKALDDKSFAQIVGGIADGTFNYGTDG